MRKLRLDLDALAVESFATDAAAAARGTIAAHGYEATPLCNVTNLDCYTRLTCLTCGCLTRTDAGRAAPGAGAALLNG